MERSRPVSDETRHKQLSEFLGRLSCFEALVACAYLDTSMSAHGHKSRMSETIADLVDGRPMTELLFAQKEA